MEASTSHIIRNVEGQYGDYNIHKQFIHKLHIRANLLFTAGNSDRTWCTVHNMNFTLLLWFNLITLSTHASLIDAYYYKLGIIMNNLMDIVLIN